MLSVFRTVCYRSPRISHTFCFALSSHCFATTVDDNQHLSDLIDDIPPRSRTDEITQRELPLMTSRKLAHMPLGIPPKQAWLETLSSAENEKLGIVDLHPDIFGVFPRIDILWANINWQRRYRYVDYRFAPNRAEMRGGGRKPWPQKGTGRARHGSIRSPIFLGGGKCFGPRGPTSHFYMLPQSVRVLGLRCALSVKYAQGDLHIVDSLNLPTDVPKYLEELIESRGWGLSVLFIDDTDLISKNIALATDKIKPYNVMPVYGLNVYSMLKHETLVLTLAALERIEEKLLTLMHRVDHCEESVEQMRKDKHINAPPDRDAYTPPPQYPYKFDLKVYGSENFKW